MASTEYRDPSTTQHCLALLMLEEYPEDSWICRLAAPVTATVIRRDLHTDASSVQHHAKFSHVLFGERSILVAC